MHACDNYYDLWICAVEHGVGEPLEEKASCIAKYDRETKGTCRDFRQAHINRNEKLVPESRPLTLVPRKCLFDFGRGGRTKNQLHYTD